MPWLWEILVICSCFCSSQIARTEMPTAGRPTPRAHIRKPATGSHAPPKRKPPSDSAARPSAPRPSAQPSTPRAPASLHWRHPDTPTPHDAPVLAASSAAPTPLPACHPDLRLPAPDPTLDYEYALQVDAEAKVAEAKKKGRRQGSHNFSKEDDKVLLEYVHMIIPVSTQDWEVIADAYNTCMEERASTPRTHEALKQRFKKFANAPKPTGDPQCPPNVVKAKQLSREILGKVHAGDIEDGDKFEDWDDHQQPTPSTSSSTPSPPNRPAQKNKRRDSAAKVDSLIEALSKDSSSTPQPPMTQMMNMMMMKMMMKMMGEDDDAQPKRKRRRRAKSILTEDDSETQ